MFENCFILILASDYKSNEVVSLLFYKTSKTMLTIPQELKLSSLINTYYT